MVRPAALPHGLTLDFRTAANLDNLTAYQVRHVPGLNSNVGTSEASVWNTGGLISYLSSAETIDVVSADANDTDGGTGARTVEIEGLNGDWELITETVTLNGTSTVTTTQQFLRVFEAEVLTVGSNGIAAGDITISSTVGTMATIEQEDGRSHKAAFTIPAGHEGLILAATLSSGKGQEMRHKLFVRKNNVAGDQPFVLRSQKNTIEAPAVLQSPFTPTLEEKTDIEWRAVSDQSASVVSVTFELLLVDLSVA